MAFRILISFNIRSLFNSFTICIADKSILLPIAFIFSIWLFFKRYHRAAFHWLAMIVLTGGAIEFFKKLFFSPRPNDNVFQITSSSFPSGHSMLALCLFGFLAVLIARELRFKLRWIPYSIAAILILLVYLSRIYLGAHWPTDILGSTFLGVTIILLVTISYRRKFFHHLAIKQLIYPALLIAIPLWSIFGLYHFTTYYQGYQPLWAKQKITLNQWKNRTAIIPAYRSNRFGHPVQAFNLEWVGNLKAIKQSLLKQHWQNHEPKLTIKGAINRLSTHPTMHRLPVIPQTYINNPPALLMTKDTAKNKPGLILRLWKSNITIIDAKNPLWLGVIDYHQAPHKILTLNPDLIFNKQFNGATKALKPYLQGYWWKQIIYPTENQPKIMRLLNWTGHILLIQQQKGI